jgi:D-glycero-D-manno-heptose 1,7-bisphosphate phosphatase
MVQQAVILCGGLGTRLGGLVAEVPKPMIEIAGKPLLVHSIQRLRAAGVTDILMAAGYKADVIRSYFEAHPQGVGIRVFDETRPLGTAGCVRALMPHLADRFLVLYGDVFIDFDLREIIDADRGRDAAATLLVRPSDHPWDSDLVVVEGERRVTGFIRAGEAREFPRNTANAAMYVVGRDVIGLMAADTKIDWVKDVFPAAIAAGMTLEAHVFSGQGFLKDMGTPRRLELVERYLAEKRLVEEARAHPKPITTVFLDRDGVINEEVDLLRDPADFRLLPGAAAAIARLNDAGMRVVVVTNQPVIARGLCSLETLAAIHARMHELLAAEGARVDAVYFCPHHPETHHRDPGSVAELRVACECRKPAPGMLLRAARELDCDLGAAVLVGDRSVDVQAATRAGVRSILLGAEPARPPRPTLVATSLAEAASAILAGRVSP